MNADPDKLDRQFKELHNKYLKYMIVQNVEIVVEN